MRHPAHEAFRSARCCLALTSSAPFYPYCKMFWPVGFRKLRRPLTETCLPKLVQPNVRYVSTLFVPLSRFRPTLCCVPCAPELFARQHAYIQWPRRVDRSIGSGIAIALDSLG